MRASMRESTRERMIRIMAFVLVIGIGFWCRRRRHGRINIRESRLSTNP